jgi:hypothetical protein
MNNNSNSVFAKHIAAVEKTKRALDVSPAQKLLNFLQRWPKDTVSLRDLRQFGPKSMRDRQSVIDSAEILVRHKWLTPIPTHRRDRREWQIARKLIVHPTVAP